MLSFTILLPFLISGCATTQKVPLHSSDTLPKKPQTEKVNGDEPIEVFTDSLPSYLKDTYNIALVLPLYLNQVKIGDDSLETTFGQQSTLAIEFYSGVKLALDDLAEDGFNAKVQVLDDLNDRLKMKEIAVNMRLNKPDLVMGPIYNNNLRLMAEHAKKDSIYMVSPLSPALNITSSNPYFIMVNPGIEMHCRKIFNYITERHYEDNIILFYRPDSDEETYAAIFKKLLKEYHAATNTVSLQFTDVIYTPRETKESSDTFNDGLELFFEEDRKNVVLIPSVSKAYMHSVGRRLFPMVDPPYDPKAPKDFNPVIYDIDVFGLPAWGEQDGLRFDYVSKMNVHFTSSYYLSQDFYTNQNSFYSRFVETFQTEPTEFAVKGYDLMLFFGQMLQKHGTAFGKMLPDEDFKGHHTNFKFGIHPAENQPSVSLDDNYPQLITDFIENQYVHLLKYEGFTVKRVE